MRKDRRVATAATIHEIGDVTTPSSTQAAFVAGQLAGTTQRAYASDLRQFRLWLHARGLDFFDGPVTRDHIRQWRDWMKQEACDGHGYANATIRRRLSCVHQFYAHALGDGLVANNPVDLVKAYRVSALSPRIPLTNNEARRLMDHPLTDQRIDAITRVRNHAILALMLYLGLRRAEVCALTCDAVQREREYDTLRVIGKGEKPRLLPLRPDLLAALRAYLTADGRADALGVSPDALFHPRRNRRGDQSTQKHLHVNSVWDLVSYHAQGVGLTHIDPHTLRATAATIASEQGAETDHIREMLGHASITTTQRYIKRHESLRDSAAWRIQY